jgi:hypothetical protein
MFPWSPLILKIRYHNMSVGIRGRLCQQFVTCRKCSRPLWLLTRFRDCTRATSIPSRGSWVGSVQTSRGLSHGFDDSSSPSTICFALGAIFTVSVVFNNQGSDSRKFISCRRSDLPVLPRLFLLFPILEIRAVVGLTFLGVKDRDSYLVSINSSGLFLRNSTVVSGVRFQF